MDAVSRYQPQSVVADDGARRLRITWSDGHRSAYPYIWLRHPLFHPAMGRPEQVPDDACLLTEDPAVPKTRAVKHDQAAIQIEWSHDDTTTKHDLVWLRKNCVSTEARAERRRLPKLWEKGMEFPWFENKDLENPEDRLRLFIHLRDYGIARIRGVPAEAGALRDIAKWFGPIHTTHFGEIFDIRSQPENRTGVGANIGATQDFAQAPHSDETYRHTPIGILFFHCIKSAPGNRGGSVYVDAIAAAERLRTRQPEAFKFLTSVPLLFTAERNPTERFRTRGRVIASDLDGIIRGVRFTDRTIPPIDLPEELIEPAYEALARFRAEVYDYSYASERVLQPGEAVIIDNHRVLHGRRSFDRQAGDRWLQQLSVDREEFQNNLRVLADALGHGNEAFFEQDAGALAI